MQQLSRERERERERIKIESNYTGSYHNPEVVLPPCTSKESSLKSISDYNCSSTEARDFKLTQAKKQEVSYAQVQLQETSYAQAQKQETFNQTELQRKCLMFNT